MEWDPTQFFRESDDPIAPFALLVLNQPINERAWTVLNNHAYFTICADGGANRFFDMMQTHGRESIDLPNIIIGDLDSIRPSVRAHYEQLGVQVLKDTDQYSTDFTKCLKYLSAHTVEIVADRRRMLSLPPAHDDARLEILVMGGLGGRVDQAFSQIHHLYVMTRGATGEPAAGNLYLISEESITFVLQAGRHRIRTPRTNRPGCSGREDGGGGDSDGGGGGSGTRGKEAEHEFYLLEENVGIIPLSGPARITTHGFEWDVEDWLTEIGGQLSTSNHIRADVVSIETRVPVLFTLELAERFKRSR